MFFNFTSKPKNNGGKEKSIKLTNKSKPNLLGVLEDVLVKVNQ